MPLWTIATRSSGTAKWASTSSFVPCETAMTASAISSAVRSTHDEAS
jgi:hypothetical protein